MQHVFLVFYYFPQIRQIEQKNVWFDFTKQIKTTPTQVSFLLIYQSSHEVSEIKGDICS